MTREPCAYCGQEERYGHNALCVMNTVEELRAEIERLRRALQAIERETGVTMLATNHGRRGDLANTIARAALEPKP